VETPLVCIEVQLSALLQRCKGVCLTTQLKGQDKKARGIIPLSGSNIVEGTLPGNFIESQGEKLFSIIISGNGSGTLADRNDSV